MIRLEDIKLYNCYYLFHLEYCNKPNPFAQIYIKIENITKIGVVVSRPGTCFLSSNGKIYYTLPFDFSFYGKTWYLYN